ncbi:hypothetical protein G6F46_000496 [Rhizopus delemar]|uniref:Guanylate cyclase domain-containing protein n=1 Tax=Rhizopus delemar TaxID=936053 RepID=A0A9P7CQ78_9FUNG|nr:hypothetical protein G6F55_001541 [Rhizopus delemar]KAG1628490.1 hypothetical protein G6F45_006888 [Rhizopus arrhizus]KAG1496445.1 hypothetical protein G6F54_006469 [Rhizopus delemar]KAG1510352.1 hypothetical protein G6F53_006747 [Rhizopus delemar]KAG1525609.1 hypothetical protein G6F52_003170 [Rhizopus delemar]
MLNIAPYIAKYVRSLHARCDKLQIPYSQSQFGVVLMVDVVGFSTLTTLAAEKGDSGAEAVALEIGTYMGKCIEIIEYFGGDVVKFLGDAVLVSFQVQSLENEMDSHEGESARDRENRQKNILVQRAFDCGLQLLARLSRYRVYLTAEERTKHRSSVDTDQRQDNNHHFFLFDESTSEHSSVDGSLQLSAALDIDYTYDATTFNLWNCIPILFGKSRKNKVYTARRRNSVKSCEMIKEKPSAVDLELHIALSCGNITNIILGEMYPANKAESDARLARIAKKNVHFSFINGDENISDHTLGYNGRLEYAICGPAVESLEDALDAAKAGEMSITSEAFDLFQGLDLSYEKRGEFYIVKGIGTQKNKNNRSYQPHFKGFPSIHTNHLAIDSSRFNQTLHIEPPTNDALNPLTSPNYLKYINQSALYRLQHSPDNNFPAQFRDVTIMFISLGKLNVATPEGLRSAQRAMRKTIRVLVKYEGILQQFAVDDKGATLLAVFGLPPLSHEREAIFAAKAAVELRDTFRSFLRDFSISLSTGVIFNSVLPQGNPYRRDPAIAGDTIILAVRMLKFPFAKKNIVCDFATKQQIGRMCEFEDHGENSVKGKVKPLQIFGLVRFASVRNKRPCGGEKNSDFIGYKSEMAEATEFVNDWMEAPNEHLLIISGPSGVGKSFFCHTLSKEIHSQDTICCWSSSTEVEKSSKYYLVKNILLALFEIIDSDQVPPNPRRRLSCYPGSPGSHAHDSIQFCALGLDGSGSSLSSSPPSPTTITTVKDLHVPSGNQNNAQLSTSFLSGSRFSNPGDDLSGENMPESSHELVDLITRCLKKCGEEEEFLPLFKVVFTALAGLHDNRATRRLDIRGRDILLTGVITRMVRYVSEHTGLVFISDDVQCK